MTAVVAIVVLLVLALLLFAANYFFRYTFLRADKPDPWNDGLGELVIGSCWRSPRGTGCASKPGSTTRAAT